MAPLAHRGLTDADAVEQAFYEALRAGDVAAVLALWADDEDVVCIHPGGTRLVGMDAVRASWEEILGDGGLEVRAIDAQRIVGATVSVHSVLEEITVRTPNGNRIVYCQATNVYAKDLRGWRLVMHHASTTAEETAGAPPSGGKLLH